MSNTFLEKESLGRWTSIKIYQRQGFNIINSELYSNNLKSTGQKFHLRAVKLIFVISRRSSYSFFVKLMVLRGGRLSYIELKNDRFLVENDRFRTSFRLKVILKIFIMTFCNFVYSKIAFTTKGKLFPQKWAIKTMKLEKISVGVP